MGNPYPLAPLIIGIWFGVLGFAVGFILGRISKTRPPQKRKCGCKHQLAVHAEDLKSCNGTVRVNAYDEEGIYVGRVSIQCPCQIYTGPRLIPEYYLHVVRTPSNVSQEAPKEIDQEKPEGNAEA